MTLPPLLLRQWRDSDLQRFAEMNADPEVMRFFLKPLSFDESKAALQRFRDGIHERGWGLWAVEVEGAFAGFTGLSEPTFVSDFTPCVEIGWRFRPGYWGRGIAFAAAREAEAFAFGHLKLPELVSFTTESNLRSRKLMERLGFHGTPPTISCIRWSPTIIRWSDMSCIGSPRLLKWRGQDKLARSLSIRNKSPGCPGANPL